MISPTMVIFVYRQFHWKTEEVLDDDVVVSAGSSGQTGLAAWLGRRRLITSARSLASRPPKAAGLVTCHRDVFAIPRRA
jgi:hypothetical protein